MNFDAFFFFLRNIQTYCFKNERFPSCDSSYTFVTSITIYHEKVQKIINPMPMAKALRGKFIRFFFVCFRALQMDVFLSLINRSWEEYKLNRESTDWTFSSGYKC